MTSNPPNGGSDNQGQGNPPNQTQWWSTPAPQDQPVTGTDPTVMGGHPGPVTGTDPTVLGGGFDAYRAGAQPGYGAPPPSQPSYPQQPSQPYPQASQPYPQASQPYPQASQPYPQQQFPPGYGQQFPPPYGQQPPMSPYPPPGKKNNTPWIVGGVIGLVLVIGVVIGVIALTGGDGGGGDSDDGGGGKYAMDKITNACAVVDPTVARQWAPNRDGAPEHTERAPVNSYAGGSLKCTASYEGNGDYSNTQDADFSFDANFQSEHGTSRYESWKKSDTKTTGSGRDSGDLPGVGSQGYYATNGRDYSSFVTLDYTCAAMDSNVSVKVELRIRAENRINMSKVGSTCKGQLQKALTALHK